MNTATTMSEFLRVILDRKWHALYEMHTRFRMSAIEIYNAAAVLQRLNIIEHTGLCSRKLDLAAQSLEQLDHCHPGLRV